jgi:hypothetical protein
LFPLTKDKFEDLILCAISSSIPVNLSANEIILIPEKLNGLRKISVLKTDRIVTLKSASVVALIGKINDENWSYFKVVFKSLVD